jgi:hypothetical protein
VQTNRWRRIEIKLQTTSKPGLPAYPGKSRTGTYLLVLRCPVYRRRDSHSGFRGELENLRGDAEGKRPKRWPREAESTEVPTRGGPPRSSGETR